MALQSPKALKWNYKNDVTSSGLASSSWLLAVEKLSLQLLVATSNSDAECLLKRTGYLFRDTHSLWGKSSSEHKDYGKSNVLFYLHLHSVSA